MEEHANLATYILSDYASWLSGSVIVYDGANLPYMSGMFNNLTEVHYDTVLATGEDSNTLSFVDYNFCVSVDCFFLFQVPNEQWDMMEAMIRRTKGS